MDLTTGLFFHFILTIDPNTFDPLYLMTDYTLKKVRNYNKSLI